MASKSGRATASRPPDADRAALAAGAPKADPSDLEAAGLDSGLLPRHVAIIMDGNGRWARQRGLPRIEGHRRGVKSVRATVEECCRLGIGQLTLYCLSIENWKRPRAELDFLMKLLRKYLVDERPEIMEQNIRFTTIGRRDGLPEGVLWEIDESVRLSRQNTGTVLCLAINYGGRTELVDAMRRLACQVQQGTLQPDAIDESVVHDALYTAGMPDPDLLIRTAGEMRVSNYLLWQISYAELWVTDKCWPDFDRATFHQALRDFAARERRFGGLKE
jgi:undecaprenyl diphosphate synthase